VVNGYRHFVVVVVLIEHAYNGPYAFHLNYKLSNDSESVYVGSVSVFARPNHSPCLSCSKRRVAGTTVRGIIPLDTKLIQEIIKHKQLDRDETEDEKLAGSFKDTFWGELKHPSGKSLGRAMPHLPERGVPSSPVEAERAPVEVSLFSASAARPIGSKDGPVRFFDWQDHGDMFEGGHLAWRTSGIELN